ncbi:MAG: hypothetical protein GY849_02115 [Deltaproteobacteria bacterium]|nr:hypothetical protein [Deltaproteobacteria bacterium]
MKLLRNYITTIEHYPDNGKHQQCNVNAPFNIRKGQDGYYYDKNQKEKAYNLHEETKTGKCTPTKKWICHLTEGASESLKKIFYIKESVNLEIILKHCTKLYIKSLKLEIKRIKSELLDLKNK